MVQIQLNGPPLNCEFRFVTNAQGLYEISIFAERVGFGGVGDTPDAAVAMFCEAVRLAVLRGATPISSCPSVQDSET